MSKQFDNLCAEAAKEGLDLQRMVRGGQTPNNRLVERVTYQVMRLSDHRLLCQNFDRADSALKFAREKIKS